jgi:hypothetical protein
MKSRKYIISRAALTVALLVVTGWIYTHYCYPIDLIKYESQLSEVLAKADTCDILYFAESSNGTYADTDKDTSSISDLLNKNIPSVQIGAINKGAVHAGVYRALIKRIPAESKANTWVVTMNLRSFGYPWMQSKLETPLMKTNLFYSERLPVINKLLMVFGYYDKKNVVQRDEIIEHHWRYDTIRFQFEYPFKTVRAWDDGFANGYYLKPDGSWDMGKISLACHYIKGYAFHIDTLTNPRIHDFDAIVKEAHLKGKRIIFNLLPENIEYADRLVGKELTYLMKQNRDLLVDRYTRMGATVVDNLELLDGWCYMDQHWTTEHYFYECRKKIADQLTLHIKVP